MNFKEYIEMAIINPDHAAAFNKAIDWIKKHNIQAIAIGGTAVTHYMTGAREKTDVDFMVSDLNQILSATKKENIITKTLALPNIFRGIHVPAFDADFIKVKEPLNTIIASTAQKEMIGNTIFPIISPEALAILKFVSGRDKDIKDAFMLLQSGIINRQKYLSLAKKIRTDELAGYAELIPQAQKLA